MEVQYNYDKFFLKDIINEKKIKVPQFQRNVVWNSKKRKEFVETLREGNPFGSILVHQSGQDYILIDGLQRVSTIKDYCRNPYNYFEYKDINQDLVLELINHTYQIKGYYFDINSSAVKESCDNIQKAIFTKMIEKLETTDICFDVILDNDLVNDKISFKTIDKIISKFKEDSDISNLIVPTIIYTGPSEKLPTIFYNLNTGGVNLSKYETFSALWSPKRFIIDDDEIVQKIYEKYEQMQKKSDLDVDVSFEDIADNGVTLFEYCYSISEILRDPKKKFSLILANNKKSTDPMGFEILSLITGLNVNKAENLDKKLMNATPEFLVKLKDLIIETFSVMTDALEYWIKGINGTNNTLDSTYMIYHMALSYIKHNYNIDLNNYTVEEVIDKKWNNRYIKNLPFYYFKDYITDFWKKNRQVSDLTREINNIDSLNKYTNKISFSEWQNAFDILKENQLYETGNQVSLKSKLFIDYLCKFKVEENPQLRKYLVKKFNDTNINIDFEHIIPQKRIENQLNNNKERIKLFPISSLGNLCYLSSTDNRAKKAKTLYEYIDNRPSYIIDKEYLSFIDYPDKEDINFIDYNATNFELEYKVFIENRIDNYINEMLCFLKK